jgi:AcrR family transcriptional regulator
MVSQAERRAGTIRAIEEAARKLFATRGFAETTIDDIAAKAGVAKGAVYHHFSSKEEIFTLVLEHLQEALATEQAKLASARIEDPLDLAAASVLKYLLSISEPDIHRILLIDGPVVVGWQKWREIDMRYFGAMTKAGLANAFGDRLSPREIDAITHLLFGAIMEAALVCATADDPKKSAKEMSAGMRILLGGLLAQRPDRQ